MDEIAALHCVPFAMRLTLSLDQENHMTNFYKNKQVLVTGAGGFIGHALRRTASELGEHWRFLPLTRADVDVTDHDAVRTLFTEKPPDLILHCAAMSRTPECAIDPQSADRS